MARCWIPSSNVNEPDALKNLGAEKRTAICSIARPTVVGDSETCPGIGEGAVAPLIALPTLPARSDLKF